MTNNWKKHFNGFRLFGKAMLNTRMDIWISVQVLFVLTLILSILLFLVEHAAQPEVYSNLWDSIIWSLMAYIDNAGNFAPADPITFVGRLLWIIIGILKIALFAVPAGIVANGFADAIKDEKRNQELAQYHHVLQRECAQTFSSTFDQYIANHPPKDGAFFDGRKLSACPVYVPFSHFELNGITLKDLIDTCEMFPGYRVRDLSMGISNAVPRYVVEPFLANRSYGGCVDRRSNVTIVAPSNVWSEVGVSNFAYYLAEIGGFNYISKEFDVAPEALETYYAMTSSPRIDGKTLAQRTQDGEKVSKEMRGWYQQMQQRRDDFMADMRRLTAGKDAWVISIISHEKNITNPTDIHFVRTTEDKAFSSVRDNAAFDKLYATLREGLMADTQLVLEETDRYPLIKRKNSQNLLFYLQEEGCCINGFVMRISSDLLLNDPRVRITEYLIAEAVKTI